MSSVSPTSFQRFDRSQLPYISRHVLSSDVAKVRSRPELRPFIIQEFRSTKVKNSCVRRVSSCQASLHLVWALLGMFLEQKVKKASSKPCVLLPAFFPYVSDSILTYFLLVQAHQLFQVGRSFWSFSTHIFSGASCCGSSSGADPFPSALQARWKLSSSTRCCLCRNARQALLPVRKSRNRSIT